MAAQRSVSMDRMWNDWHATFPDTIRLQDGWIGDLAHSTGSSGHNPDDTAGVTAERIDADSKQEVRAIDKDKRLNAANGTTLEQVVQRMLRTPNDLKRLIYIIYNRRIWRKSNGWKQETYTGSDPHDMHAHFSGDPAFDEDGAPWVSITSFGADMAALESSDPSYNDLIFRVAALFAGTDQLGGPGNGANNKLQETLDQILAQASSNGVGISELKTMIAQLSIAPTDAQWAAFMNKLDELFAGKVGEFIEASYASTAFKNGVKAAVAAQLDDNPAT